MPGCQFNLEFDDEEIAGLQWLNKVLVAIYNKGPEHKSYDLAKGLTRALHKIEVQYDTLHDAAHVLEHRNECLGVEVSKWRMQFGDWGQV